jgi:hypothetical protein
MSTTSSARALLAASRACIREAERAHRLGQYRYARALRRSADNALAEIRAITPPVAVGPEEAARQEKARIFAKILMPGLH